MVDFGAVLTNTALVRAIHFDASDIGRGATAPTEVTIGTSPAVPALLFDATNETAVVVASFRPDMDLTQDMTLRLQWALVNVQVNADELAITFDYVVYRINTTGAGPDKTSTQILATQQVTTANGLAINDVYAFEATIAAADATNPFNVANAAGIAIELHLTNIAGVTAMHVLDGDLEYAALY